MGDIGNTALVTLDGTDCPVEFTFASKFMSHKFCGNGVKYEVGGCIQTGYIVWIHGPFRCGTNNITVARGSFLSFLHDGEMSLADSGYQGENEHIKTRQLYHYRNLTERGAAKWCCSKH